MKGADTMRDEALSEERHGFQAEVGRLLDIVAHSLYSERSIFLRELISNASDACDRLRYLALTSPELAAGDSQYRVSIAPDAAAHTLTVADNGIGMNREELVANLGTIARSGTSAFLAQTTGDAAKDLSLIGQFGVGFYAAFMVAEKVEVFSRRAGESEGWRWVSDGKGEFAVAPAADVERGTRIVLHMRKDASSARSRGRCCSFWEADSNMELPTMWADGGGRAPATPCGSRFSAWRSAQDFWCFIASILTAGAASQS